MSLLKIFADENIGKVVSGWWLVVRDEREIHIKLVGGRLPLAAASPYRHARGNRGCHPERSPSGEVEGSRASLPPPPRLREHPLKTPNVSISRIRTYRHSVQFLKREFFDGCAEPRLDPCKWNLLNCCSCVPWHQHPGNAYGYHRNLR